MTRPRSSFAAGGAVAVTALGAAALGAIPWIAGTFTVVEPGLARLALFVGAGSGIIAIGTATFARRVHPALRSTALALGLLTAASSPAFVALMANPPPAEPRTAGRPTTAGATAGTDRLRVLQLNAYHGYPDSEGRLLPPTGDADRLGRAKRLEAAIARLRPDIVVLQEAWCTVTEGCLADRLAGAGGFHAVYARATGRCDGWASRKGRRSSAGCPSPIPGCGRSAPIATPSSAGSR